MATRAALYEVALHHEGKTRAAGEGKLVTTRQLGRALSVGRSTGQEGLSKAP